MIAFSLNDHKCSGPEYTLFLDHIIVSTLISTKPRKQFSSLQSLDQMGRRRDMTDDSAEINEDNAGSKISASLLTLKMEAVTRAFR